MDRKIIQAVIFLLLLATGCKPKEEVLPHVPLNAAGAKTYVICEGALGSGGAALGLYLPQTDSAYNDVYRSANNIPTGGVGWGDVFQSMTRIGSYYFLCLNNSGWIAVINTADWKLVKNIYVPNPRYILPISATKAYVSTYSSNKVYIINPQTFAVTGNILTPFRNPEGMVLAGSKAIICNWDTAAHSLTAIDTATDMLASSIPLPNASPTDALLDAENHLWVLSGNSYQGKSAVLTCMDAATGVVLHNFSFPFGADPLKLCINTTGDMLYWIEAVYVGSSTANNGVFRMNIHDGALPSHAFIPAASRQYFWAVGIEPASGNVYVGDPKDWMQQGGVSIYKPDGTLVKTFSTGVGPGHFYFEQ